MNGNRDLSEIRQLIALEAAKPGANSIPPQEFTFDIPQVATRQPSFVTRAFRKLWRWDRPRIWFLRSHL
jgi:hypothetical protein